MTAPRPIYGVKEALADLEGVEPALLAALDKSMSAIQAPIEHAVSAAMPRGAPLSGMVRGRLRWSPADRRATVYAPGRPGRGGRISLVQIVLYGGAGQMADLARGGTDPRRFSRNMTGRYGSASRFVWPAALAELPKIQKATIAAVEAMSATVSAELAKTPKGV